MKADDRFFLVDSLNPTGYAQVLVERSGMTNGSDVRRYAVGDDMLGQDRGAAMQSLLMDGHGSTRQLYDGGVIERYDYDAFGEAFHYELDDPGSSVMRPKTDLLYAGEQWDADLGMQYLRARYYLPGQGIFNRLDPFFGNTDDPQSLHKYTYTHNDPVNGIDPSGLFTLSEVVANIGNTLRIANQSFRPIVRVLRTLDRIIDVINMIQQLRSIGNLISSIVSSAGGGTPLPQAVMTGIQSYVGVDSSAFNSFRGAMDQEWGYLKSRWRNFSRRLSRGIDNMVLAVTAGAIEIAEPLFQGARKNVDVAMVIDLPSPPGSRGLYSGTLSIPPFGIEANGHKLIFQMDSRLGRFLGIGFASVKFFRNGPLVANNISATQLLRVDYQAFGGSIDKGVPSSVDVGQYWPHYHAPGTANGGIKYHHYLP